MIDGVHMDYVLYGRDTGSDGDNPDGDISFDGSSWPRSEVIRNTQSSPSFYEGMTRRESAADLYAGYDVAGYYTDEDALGDGYPNGVWTSPHDGTYGGYTARNSTSAAVLAASLLHFDGKRRWQRQCDTQPQRWHLCFRHGSHADTRSQFWLRF